MADRLLLKLLQAGAKASEIARLCRSQTNSFSAIVQEKGILKNNKIDFKTLADVFIQQVVKTEISTEFPELCDRVYGEENCKFTNADGEKFTVEMRPDEDETADLLRRVFCGKDAIARSCAACAHSDVNCTAVEEATLERLAACKFDVSDVGVWVDPIDATSQYVKGIENGEARAGVYENGLQCVTVLIGAYHVTSGAPLMGIVYQPFHHLESGVWKSKSFWGVCLDDLKLNNVTVKELHMERHLVVTSALDELSQKALESRMQLCVGGGAGYKCLCVIVGAVDAFVHPYDACYRWDTCAVHAILLSLGGGVACLRGASNNADDLSLSQLRYNRPNAPPHHPWANVGGMLAYSGSERSRACAEAIRIIKVI